MVTGYGETNKENDFAALRDYCSLTIKDIKERYLGQFRHYVFHPQYMEKAFYYEMISAPLPLTIDDLLKDGKKKIGKLTREEERSLFRMHNGCEYLVSDSFEKGETSEAVVYLARKALTTRDVIYIANKPIISAVGKKFGGDRDEYNSEANSALLTAVEKFDLARGIKFSSYAYNGIAMAMNRVRRNMIARNRIFPCSFDPALHKGYYSDTLKASIEEDYLMALKEMLKTEGLLTPRRWMIVIGRYGLQDLNLPDKGKIYEENDARGKGILDSSAAPMSLKEIGEKIGVTKEAVRQVSIRALKKLRSDLEAQLEEDYSSTKPALSA